MRLMPKPSNFNPRPPRGGRLQDQQEQAGAAGISIHAPREGGDGALGTTMTIRMISIHAPREGGDSSRSAAAPFIQEFQSTPPARGATL